MKSVSVIVMFLGMSAFIYPAQARVVKFLSNMRPQARISRLHGTDRSFR